MVTRCLHWGNNTKVHIFMLPSCEPSVTFAQAVPNRREGSIAASHMTVVGECYYAWQYVAIKAIRLVHGKNNNEHVMIS